MNKKDIENHELLASKMDREQLSDTIIDLEIEKAELLVILTKKEIQKYDKLLDIYEKYKQIIVDDTTIYSPWSAIAGGFEE